MTGPELTARMESAAFAFRGYNVTNLGRTPELLEHPAYGPIVERHLREASEWYAAATSQPVDLVNRVRQREETDLAGYAEALCLIVAVELAQLELLNEFFGIQFTDASRALGYSLGEVSALVAAEMYSADALLTPILKLTDDCVELAQTVQMGIVFSRGPELNLHDIERLCVEVTAQNQGTVCISSYVAPNTVLILGQGASVQLFRETMKKRLAREVHFKKNPHRWPPIHTAIVRQRNVPDRASVMLETVPGGLQEPTIQIISCITGTESYNDYNSRQTLYDWVDHPQKLWSVIERVLATDIHTVIHVGPQPNIIPATLNRLSMNIESQLSARSLSSFGLRAVSSIVHGRPWLAKYLSRNASLLRAPLIEQIILEDWLLDHAPEA